MNPAVRRLTRPRPDTLAMRLCAGRAVLATGFLAAPVPSARLLGIDTGTARRISWLTRMMAVRDGALGVGGLAAARRGADPAPWLLAGAASDAVDALVLAQALRRGRLRGPVPAAFAPAAAAAAVVGVAAAVGLRRYTSRASWPRLTRSPRSPRRWCIRHSTW